MIQTKLDESFRGRSVTAFSPPGILVEGVKYPILQASVLASRQGSEFISIYDHPDAWGGLDSEAILTMRRYLYRFGVQIDAKTMEPSHHAETLQTIALSVNPLAVRFEAGTIPQKDLVPLGGVLPTSPFVDVQSIELLNQPEISKVAQRITDLDIPAAESIWKLLDYEYSLDQIARLMSVGLLGRMESRRMLPTKSAYKACIDTFINRCVAELIDRPLTSKFAIATGEVHGDVFTVFSQPGMPRVDYVRIQRKDRGIERGSSFEGMKNISMDSKTSIFADHARFSVYSQFIQKRKGSHVTVFHLSRSQKNDILGPWHVRAGVKAVIESDTLELDTRENAFAVLESLLSPNLAVWTQGTPLAETLNIERKPVEPSIYAATLG